MIDSRLFKVLSKEKVYLIYLVLLKFFGQFLNIGLIYCMAIFISELVVNHIAHWMLFIYPLLFCAGWVIQIKLSSYLSFQMSREVKKTLRKKLFYKLYTFGLNYTNYVRPSDVAQLSVQGIEQLDIYYGSFLPQIMYAFIAPIVLFIILSQINMKIALILLVGVILIPSFIMLFQRLAKRVTSEYWGSYLDLSDIFFNFLTAMTTLKVFDADAKENERLNAYAEKFRKDTMRLLYVQLNNITIMDIVGFGGAAVGMSLALFAYQKSEIDLFGLIIFILISAEMFIPLRQLGALFHVAMGGMSSAKQLFDILDIEVEKNPQSIDIKAPIDIKCQGIGFSYDKKRRILNKLDIQAKSGQIISIVGESGSGKSTLASLISGKIIPNEGTIEFNQVAIAPSKCIDYVALIDNHPYFFNGSVRYNLKVARPDATDIMLWQVLEQVNLKAYFELESGLDTQIQIEGANLSGGQRQRLALARALLKDSPVYIFDESTSNIDSVSEQAIYNVIDTLKKDKTIIIISHRLNHTKKVDYVYFLKDGNIGEQGSFKQIYAANGQFKTMYDQQIALENWRVNGA